MSNSQELTREQVQAVLLDPLLPASRFLSAGPRIFDSPTGAPLRLPTMTVYDLTGGGTAASAAYWVGEAEPIPEADPDFGEVTLLPPDLKSLKVLTRFSSELARHAVVDIATALQASIVRRLSVELDRAFLTGSGVDDTIRGVASWVGTQQITGVGSVGLDDLLDAEGMLLAANANEESHRCCTRGSPSNPARKTRPLRAPRRRPPGLDRPRTPPTHPRAGKRPRRRRPSSGRAARGRTH